jgi:hypothetical protein
MAELKELTERIKAVDAALDGFVPPPSDLLERRVDRLERGLIELLGKHQAMLGKMGPRTPTLDEIITELEAQ